MFAGHSFHALISRTLICVLAFALGSCKKKHGDKPASKPQRDRWAQITTDAAGLDKTKLDEFALALHGSGVVIRKNAVAYEWGDPHKALDVASASKAVYSFLVFKAVEDGLIASLDEPVVKWMPELASLNAALNHKDSRITWRHLITQTSCYGVTEQPGAAFDYNDYQTGLLWTLIFEKLHHVSGEEGIRAIKKDLFDAVEAEDKPALRAMRSNDRLFRLTASCLDMARFGSLFLHGGKWKERQVIGAEYVDLVLNHPLPLSLPRTRGEPAEMLPNAPTYGGGRNQDDHLGCYSHMWWLNRRDREGRLLFPSAPEDAMAAIGYGGEKVLMVVPSLDMIVCWNTENLTRGPMISIGRTQMDDVLKILFSGVRK